MCSFIFMNWGQLSSIPIIHAETNKTKLERSVEQTTLEINLVLYDEQFKVLPKQKVQLIQLADDGHFEIISEQFSDFKGQVKFNHKEELKFQVTYGLLINDELQPLSFYTDTPTSWMEPIQLSEEEIVSNQLNRNNLDEVKLPSKNISIQLIDTKLQPISEQLITISNNDDVLEEMTDKDGIVTFDLDHLEQLTDDIFNIQLNHTDIPYQIIPSTHMRLIAHETWPITRTPFKEDETTQKKPIKTIGRKIETTRSQSEAAHSNSSSNDKQMNEEDSQINSLRKDSKQLKSSENETNQSSLSNEQSIRDSKESLTINEELQQSNSEKPSIKPIKKSGSTVKRELPQTGEKILYSTIIGLLIISVGLSIYYHLLKKEKMRTNRED